MYIMYNTPCVLPGGDSWPTPLGTWCSTSGSTHQTHVCQRLHLVESEPLIVYMDDMKKGIYIHICFTAIGFKRGAQMHRLTSGVT